MAHVKEQNGVVLSVATGKRLDLQLLRGLAVVLVLGYHLGLPGFNNGFLGVDIFFVLSGYLMATILPRRKAGEFLKYRFLRLAPPYFFVILATVVTASFTQTPHELRQVSNQSVASLLFLPNVFFWSENSYFSDSLFKPLLHLWSLGVEVQFYLIFPLLFWLFRKSKWALPALLALSLTAALGMTLISPKTSFFWMPLRLWQFLAGAAVALMQSKLNPGKGTRYLGVALLLPLIAALLVFELTPAVGGSILSAHPAFAAVIVTFLTATIIAFGIGDWFFRFAPARVFASLGDVSYSLYLVHFPILVFLNSEPFGGTVSVPQGFSQTIIGLTLIILFTWISFRFFERYRRNASFAFGVVSVMVLLTSVTIPVAQSLRESQYSFAENAAFEAIKDQGEFRCGQIQRLIRALSPVCILSPGDTAEAGTRVLLVGDSFADSIKDTFVRAAGSNDVEIKFLAANDWLLGRGKSAIKLARIAEKEEISAVFVHYSNFYGNVSRSAEILDFIALMDGRGIPVSLLAPVPGFPGSVPKAVVSGEISSEDFQVTTEDYSLSLSNFWKTVGPVISTNVSVIDPTRFLCSEGICPPVSDTGVPYYFDSIHLTLTGSNRLEPAFVEYFRGVKITK